MFNICGLFSFIGPYNPLIKANIGPNVKMCVVLSIQYLIGGQYSHETTAIAGFEGQYSLLLLFSCQGPVKAKLACQGPVKAKYGLISILRGFKF